MQTPLLKDDLAYRGVRDGDPLARSIAERHYSRRKFGTKGACLFIGPGTKMALIGVYSDWLFIWRRSIFRMDGQTGVECTLFRNEGHTLSSTVILMAEAAWDAVHGPTRKFTYVDPASVRPKANPGQCFLKADWIAHPGTTTRGLILLSKEAAIA